MMEVKKEVCVGKTHSGKAGENVPMSYTNKRGLEKNTRCISVIYIKETVSSIKPHPISENLMNLTLCLLPILRQV